MKNRGDFARRARNAAAAAISFLLIPAAGYAARFAVSFFAEPTAALSGAIGAAAVAAAIAVLLAVFRPAPPPADPVPDGMTTHPAPTARRAKPFSVPAAIFALIVTNVTLSAVGLGSTGAEPSSVPASLIACFLAPVVEETFFRGVLPAALSEDGDPVPLRIAAAAVSAAAFAAVHGGALLFPLFAGLILTVPARAAGRTFLPIGAVIAHSAYNVTVTAAAYLERAGVAPLTTFAVAAGLSAAAAGVLILISGGKKK